MAELQLDTRNPLAPVLVPYLLDVDLPRRLLPRRPASCCGTGTSTSPPTAPPAAYFNVVWRDLLDATFHDELPEDAVARRRRPLDRRDGRAARRPDVDLVGRPRAPPEVETRDDILAARDDRGPRRDDPARRGARLDGWEWGHLHRLDLHSPTLGESGIGPVEWLVNRGGWEVGGGRRPSTRPRTLAADGYVVDSAPSMRMVVSLADLDDSRWINLTGVSGHPFSAHYTDQTDLWARGETLPWAFTRDAVDGSAQHTLTLQPADPTAG